MSVNLGRTDCYFCGTYPVLDEEPRLMTLEDSPCWYDGYPGMIVAKASCPQCCAKYIAWVKDSALFREKHGGREQKLSDYGEDATHFDLSFRSTFRDEPGRDDIPLYEVVYEPRRVGPYKGFWADRWKDEEES